MHKIDTNVDFMYYPSMFTPRQMVEVFHLQFLRAFGARVDKSLYALKGGCNLRFFYRSVRYSENMDIDVRTLSVSTLRSNVGRVLDGIAFRQSLRAHSIEIAEVSAPKQTTTTQRWKISLRAAEGGSPVPTKIEFSRRGFEGKIVVESVESEILRAYRLYPVFVQHYAKETAFEQKVAALALREQVQSRDIFDLGLLLAAGAGGGALSSSVSDLISPAIDHALAVTHAAFVSQVVSYMDPEFQAVYADRGAWDTLQSTVIDALQAHLP